MARLFTRAQPVSPRNSPKGAPHYRYAESLGVQPAGAEARHSPQGADLQFLVCPAR